MIWEFKMKYGMKCYGMVLISSEKIEGIQWQEDKGEKGLPWITMAGQLKCNFRHIHNQIAKIRFDSIPHMNATNMCHGSAHFDINAYAKRHCSHLSQITQRTRWLIELHSCYFQCNISSCQSKQLNGWYKSWLSQLFLVQFSKWS